MSNNDEFLWTEKYRPQTVEECILPESLKDNFRGFVRNKGITNSIFHGTPGIGKTSVAEALLRDIDADYMLINGSLNMGIDTLRNDISDFASTSSFIGGRKYIILDEADGISKSVQEGLKGFIEKYASNCGFIFTCNSLDRIDSAIKSRFAQIAFDITTDDIESLGKQFYDRIGVILEKENVTFSKVVLAKVIKKFYPDWRRILNEIQSYINKYNKLDSGILVNKKQEDLKVLVGFLKNKQWTEMRKWIGERNIDQFATFASNLLAEIEGDVQLSCLPTYIVYFNEHQYKDNFVADKTINLVAFLTRIMSDMVWK